MSIKRIVISQARPTNFAPYEALQQKFGVTIDFQPFYLIEPLTSREFRSQRINLPEYTAIVFSARHTIDAFFRLCVELRVKVPETMKYFCTTEAVALYLQKHIVYRKRKIFFGNGTPQSVIEQIGTKHKDEKFLITTSDSTSNEAITSLFEKAGLDFTTAQFVKSVSQDLKEVKPLEYDAAVVYNPADLKSLNSNFPDFKPGNLKFVTYGKHIARAMEEAGIPIAVKAPTPETPSVAKALEVFLSAQN